MSGDPIPSVEELREEFVKHGLQGMQAFVAAQQKYIDLTKGMNLPYEFYVTGELPVEGEIC